MLTGDTIEFINLPFSTIAMIRIIAVGKIKEPFFRQGIEEFVQRIQKYAKLEILEIKDSTKEAEGEKHLRHVRDNPCIALDAKGKQYLSEEFAALLKKIEQEGKHICFLIGSEKGLPHAVLQRADLVLSLSSMTFLHEMTRLILVEQLYRAITIQKGLKYHK